MAEPNFSVAVDPVDHLPLSLLRSDILPPSPTRSTIDWIPDLAGYAWVAYGASSLLVISHLPKPHQPITAPFFRQVFDLPHPVAAVSCSSDGRVAAASGDGVFIFSPHSSRLLGSFCWSQNAILKQSSTVEAVKWTGSGDGLIAGGVEVVLWKNKSISWEIAWKFKANQAQNLVSATWSIDGPSAAAAYLNEQHLGEPSVHDKSKLVLVCQRNQNSEYVKTELLHPQPVHAIQWRPSAGTQPEENLKSRHVLLTCCLDGAVRLWTEIEYGRVRKVDKDLKDQKITRRSFFVVAIIETNAALGRALDENLLVTWAVETRGLFRIGKERSQLFPTEANEHGKTGRCEWIVGIGRDMKMTFWAIHCLDEFSPLRFPRVTLWKSKDLKCYDLGCVHKFPQSKVRDGCIVSKVIISRNSSAGPPSLCSFIYLSPCNLMVSLQLYNGVEDNVRDLSVAASPTEEFFSCSAGEVVTAEGHSGKILRVSVHPYYRQVELAVSLDAYGSLLFWSFSTIASNFPGLPAIMPSWKLCGKFVIQENDIRYTSLVWAPLVMDDDLIVLLGHRDGVDCFVVKVSLEKAQTVECNRICTIPFCRRVPPEDGPTDIFTVPLTSKDFMFGTFILLAAWINGFHALSWEITLQSYDLLGSHCEGDCGRNYPTGSHMLKFENSFGGKRYSVCVSPCTSQFPDPPNREHVTCFSVVNPCLSYSFMHPDWSSANNLCSCPAYVMATGFSDGNLKLWKSNWTRGSTASETWELVGMVAAHQKPIDIVCLSDCCRRIATACGASNSDNISSLNIWGAVNTVGAGHLVLEDTLSLDGNPVAMKWLALGNGQLILGVCMQDKLQIYAERRSGGQSLLNSGGPSNMHVWFSIAYAHLSSPVSNFLWGPHATAVVVHENYICSFSQVLFFVNEVFPGNFHQACDMDGSLGAERGPKMDILPPTFHDLDSHTLEDLSVENSSKPFCPRITKTLSMDCDLFEICLLAERAEVKYSSTINFSFWSILEVLEKLCGCLPVYHPEALLFNILSGNWKRAFLALQHLVAHLSSYAPLKRANSDRVIPQIALPSYLGGFVRENSGERKFQWNEDAASVRSSLGFARGPIDLSAKFDFNASNSLLLESEVSGFINSLERWAELEVMHQKDKSEVLAIIDLLGELNSHSASVYESLDESGRRFWVAIKYKQRHFLRKHGRVASVEELVIDSASICWAFHSDCQENLLNSVLPNASSWPEIRAMGVGLWFTDTLQLRARMEKLARLQYLRKKDPKDCALLYVSLNRLQVLAGLFKLSKEEKDKPLVGFLLRNFQEEKNRAAALKNAYVLLGRHQLELAIAFFLLGGDISSAITVCFKNLGDEQLALVICRLIEGYGGPMEHQLITKFMLPSAIEKGDYWLSSLLQWQLGNYSQSFLSMFNCQNGSVTYKSNLSSNNTAFMDPSIGLYCHMLAAKNRMKNALGEQNAVLFGRWASLITATALKRSGLHLEALEHISASSFHVGSDYQSMLGNGPSQILLGGLQASGTSSYNWLSDDVSVHLESHYKFDWALQFFSKMMREHPSWLYSSVDSAGPTSRLEYELHEWKKLLPEFRDKLYASLALIEQKFSVDAASLLSMISVWAHSNGFSIIGYDLLHRYYCQLRTPCKSNLLDSVEVSIYKLPLAAAAEVSILFSQFSVACIITCSQLKFISIETNDQDGIRSRWSSWGFQFRNLLVQIGKLKAIFLIAFDSIDTDLISKLLSILDLLEYFAHFASFWFQRNLKALILILQPLLVSFVNGHTPYGVNMEDLSNVLHQMANLVPLSCTVDDIKCNPPLARSMSGEQEAVQMIPEDEGWQIFGCSLWEHMSRFMNHKLSSIMESSEDSLTFGDSLSEIYSSVSRSYPQADEKNINKQVGLLSIILAQSLKTVCAHVSSYHIEQLSALLQQKIDAGRPAMTLVWLDKHEITEPRPLREHLKDADSISKIINSNDEHLIYETLWTLWVDPQIVLSSLALEKINWSEYANMKPLKRWSEVHKSATVQDVGQENHSDGQSANSRTASPSKILFPNGNSLLSSWRKEVNVIKEVTHFQSPKDVFRINGELLEALCINSTDQRQIAVSGNRKGLVFFKLEGNESYGGAMDYVWSEADWPQHGWASSESTPAPTCTSPRVGLGSKKGAHLRLGGMTVGGGSLATPRRDLTGGGAFGIPGYAGIGASGLGWEVQEEFEELVEYPATLENVRTRALSSHPSMPYFLVGSSNTHIYLWEFGKKKAIATYGVLPAANIPPPYALASVSALQFDHCGHRFATSALDGSICTWQLEVGGRSNIRPTESSHCFNGHASDVTYVTSSGSIIAAAGCSSNSMNVIVWDTLAPPSTSRASISCHEGGARSVSVFDSEVGNSSVSPLILTGGKDGDVGLHDFRYIATGKSRRYRNSDNVQRSGHASLSTGTPMGIGTKIGVENVGGMLWYIPKAHLGSVTKISPIPQTSLFLTGSKDGDVKLWDVKSAKLLHHWSKLHERHTFLQPSTRGFGGVVRAGVTDVRVLSHGFLTSGGDGSVKLIQLKDFI